MLKTIAFIIIGLLLLSLWHIRQYKIDYKNIQNDVTAQIIEPSITKIISSTAHMLFEEIKEKIDLSR